VRKVTFGIAAKVTVFLVLIPGAVFAGHSISLIAATMGLLTCLCIMQIGTHVFGRWLLKSVAPFALVLLGLMFVTQAGALAEVLKVWAAFGLRLIILMGFGFLFVQTTDPLDIPTFLIRLGIPHRFGITLMVGYRFLPLMMDRLGAITMYQAARGGPLTFYTLRRLRRSYDRLLALLVPAIHSALEIALGFSDTLYIRGYRPELPITIEPRRGQAPQDACLLAFGIFTVCISIYERL
jgi:energy-coupling factor transporter transmembrane protein EcfT